MNRHPFRIGETNIWVKPGDFVWADQHVARIAAPGQIPVVTTETICGRVLLDGTVLLTNNVIVELRTCRLERTVIRI